MLLLSPDVIPPESAVHAPIDPTPLRSFTEPGARPDRRRPVPVRPLHVALDVRLDPAVARVSGHVTHTVQALGSGVATLPFDAADMRITRAARGEAACAVVPHAGGADVLLDPPLAEGERAEVTLWFESKPTMGLYFVDGDPPQAWTQGAMEDHHHWFPCFDAPQHMVTTEVIATVPARYVALSNGEPAVFGEAAGEGWRRFHWRHETPHALYLLTLVVDALVCVEDHRGSVPLYHYVPAGREGDAKALFARVPEMVEWIGEATGRPYPYPRYGHAFLRGFMWGGMENTTLTSLTETALVDGQHVEEEELERLVAHELAHQWFGDLIAPRGWPEIWLNESFATYFDILTMHALDGEDQLVTMLADYRASYLEEASKRYVRPVVTRTYVHPYVLFDRHAYEKGALSLHTLRYQLGEAGFWRGLRLYVERAAGTAAETADLRRAFEDATGDDLTDFFEQFVYREGHVEVKVEWTWRPRVGLSLVVERTDDGPQRLDVELAVHARGETRRRRLPVEPGTRAYVLPIDAPPRWVALDPESHCLVEIDEGREPDSALLARLEPRHAPIALRVRTAKLVGDRGTPAMTEALAASLRDDPSWAVRVAVAGALGEHRSDAARQALLDAARDDTHWRVRAAAGAALGQGADAGWVKTLEGLFAAEKSPRVRAAILGGVGAIRDRAAATMLRRHLDQPSPRDRIAAAAISGLAAQEDPDTIDELLLRTEAGHPKGVRRAAIAGLSRIGRIEGLDKKEARRIRRTLEERLRDDDFHVRYSAIGAAQSLGDKALVPALERAHGAERFALLQRMIREALGALKGEGAGEGQKDGKGQGGKG